MNYLKNLTSENGKKFKGVEKGDCRGGPHSSKEEQASKMKDKPGKKRDHRSIVDTFRVSQCSISIDCNSMMRRYFIFKTYDKKKIYLKTL